MSAFGGPGGGQISQKPIPYGSLVCFDLNKN